MNCERLFEMQKDSGKADFAGACHDCGRGVRVVSEKTAEGSISVRGGAVYESGGGLLFKCEDCFGRDKTVRKYRECEVYSRVVGYLRPVSQWNSGKLAEYGRRKTLRV